MINIKTPEFYISEPGAVNQLSEFTNMKIHKGNRKVIVVWSKTPKAILEKKVAEDFEKAGIEYQEFLFEGFPTDEKAERVAQQAEAFGASVLIAAGGGRVMDVTKAAGNIAELPVITVPTIAATCAPWAAVSIIYTEEGDFKRFQFNSRAPEVILADTEIIAAAPIRYIKSGIVDTFAKWYEPRYDTFDTYVTHISRTTSKLAYDFLSQEGVGVVENLEKGIVDEKTIKTIDAIIFLAGNIGSFIGGEAFSGYAHPFYHSSRRFPSTQVRMHGELVAFGLVLQGVYEKKPEDEIFGRIRLFDSFDNAYELSELGLDTDEKLQVVARRIITDFKHEENPPKEEVNGLFEALKQTDAYVKEYRRKRKTERK